MRIGVGLAMAAALALASQPVWAQDEPANKHQRQGFYIGIGLGYGTLSIEGAGETEGGFSGNLRLGTALSQNVLIGVQTNGWYKSENNVTLTFGTLTGAVQFYPSANGGFFLNAGLGLATLTLTGFDAEYGLGAVLGLGYDFRVGRNISITPFLNGFGSSIEETNIGVGQIGVGVTFH
jgi:hypothetical protein